MELSYCQTTSKEELEQILVLQRANQLHNISREIREREGFVTVQHTLPILTRMHATCPHIIAKDGEKVAGYALCMHPKFAEDIEVLKPMFAEINTVLPEGASYMAMGQICVAEAYRRQGVFRKLYETMKACVRPEFNAIITEVDEKNTRSLHAHYAVGFADLKTYSSGGQDWKLIILEWK